MSGPVTGDPLSAAIAAAVRAELAPLRAEIERLVSEVATIRSLPSLVPIPEAASALGLSLSTIRRRVKDGTIPSRRIGRALRVDLTALRGEDDPARVAALAHRTQAWSVDGRNT